MASPVKKRNLKGLQLSPKTAKPGTQTTTPTLQLPLTGGSAGGSADEQQHQQKTAKRSTSKSDTSSTASSSSYNVPGGGSSESNSSGSGSRPSSVPSSASSNPYHNKLSEQLATLEMGLEFKLDLRAEDLKVLEELGSGNGGTVCKVTHVPTKRTMARKVIHIDTKPSVRKQIIRELQIMHDCSSVHVVGFFGAFIQEPHINICMEYMDKGSLDNAYRRNGAIPEPILAQVALSVVSGLTYLYEKHRIIHRDVKPSNILLNSRGELKLCDFGVSGEAIFNSVVDTFVGTQIYMSPERLQGGSYTTKGDTWSLGITLVEVGLARFPFYTGADDPATETTLTPAIEAKRNSLRPPRLGGDAMGGPPGGLAPFEMMMLIVHEPSPRLNPTKFSKDAVEFVDACLLKDVLKRPTPRELLSSQWIVDAISAEVDLAAWAQSLV